MPGGEFGEESLSLPLRLDELDLGEGSDTRDVSLAGSSDSEEEGRPRRQPATIPSLHEMCQIKIAENCCNTR